MVRKLGWLLIMSMGCTAGCTSHGHRTDYPQKRPLGRNFDAYTPPAQGQEHEKSQVKKFKSPDIITYDHALARALLHNPQLQAFAWSVRAADARQLQAGLRPNPEFGVELENLGGSGSFQGTGKAETTVVVGQLIETGGKRAKRIRIAGLDGKLAGWDYEAKRLQVLTEASRAFVGVLAVQEALLVIKQQVQLSERILEVVEQRVQAGNDSPLEATKARVSLTQVRIEQKRLLRELFAVRRALVATWGADEVLFARVEGTLKDLLSPPDEAVVQGLIGQHPDVARWDTEIEQRQAHISLENANALPDPTLVGGYRHFNEADASAFVLGLSLPLPVTNRNQGNILEAKVALTQARRQREAALAGIRAKLSRAYADLTSAYMTASDLQHTVLPGAQGAFDSAQTGYQNGKYDYLAVLDAQRTLFDAQTQYLEALVDYHRAKAEVEQLIGQSLVEVQAQDKEQNNKES